MALIIADALMFSFIAMTYGQWQSLRIVALHTKSRFELESLIQFNIDCIWLIPVFESEKKHTFCSAELI